MYSGKHLNSSALLAAAVVVVVSSSSAAVAEATDTGPCCCCCCCCGVSAAAAAPAAGPCTLRLSPAEAGRAAAAGEGGDSGVAEAAAPGKHLADEARCSPCPRIDAAAGCCCWCFPFSFIVDKSVACDAVVAAADVGGADVGAAAAAVLPRDATVLPVATGCCLLLLLLPIPPLLLRCCCCCLVTLSSDERRDGPAAAVAEDFNRDPAVADVGAAAAEADDTGGPAAAPAVLLLLLGCCAALAELDTAGQRAIAPLVARRPSVGPWWENIYMCKTGVALWGDAPPLQHLAGVQC